ncbi:MAG: S41 family peptidase [Clostridia bacterium]|nr:S41 family peptidase [Clostridia bacterium]
MKKIAKNFTAICLSCMLVLSCVPISAQEEKTPTYAEIIESTAQNISVFGRYDSLFEDDLYVKVLEELIGDDHALYEKAMRTMVESVDENSAYYTKEEAKALMEDLGEEIVGIGVNILSDNGNLIVSSPIPDSPAERAGIKSGDIIIGADNIDLRDVEFETAVNYIRGQEGTTVKIKVLRSGFSDPIVFSVVRETVVAPATDLEILEEEGKKVAKISIYSFTENVAKEFEEIMKEVDEKGIKNIVIDLRNNGGGYLDQAVLIADMFLEDGQMITTEDHKMDVLDKVYVATGKKTDYNIAVLTNGMSASASEVLTAALKENGAARVIGEKTYGKGTVQSLRALSDGAMIKFTVAYYLTPLGSNIHKMGIMPDVQVKNSSKPVDMSKYDFFKLNKVYKVGDKGEEVRQAKEMLELLGLFVGEINDVYDENLKIAVNNFQQAKKLFPYGVLDITTQMNLYDTVRTAEVENDDQLAAALRGF